MGSSEEEKYDHPTQKPVELYATANAEPHQARRGRLRAPSWGAEPRSRLQELTERVCYGIELDPKYVDVVIQRWQTLSGRKRRWMALRAHSLRLPRSGRRMQREMDRCMREIAEIEPN